MPKQRRTQHAIGVVREARRSVDRALRLIKERTILDPVRHAYNRAQTLLRNYIEHLEKYPFVVNPHLREPIINKHEWRVTEHIQTPEFMKLKADLERDGMLDARECLLDLLTRINFHQLGKRRAEAAFLDALEKHLTGEKRSTKLEIVTAVNTLKDAIASAEATHRGGGQAWHNVRCPGVAKDEDMYFK